VRDAEGNRRNRTQPSARNKLAGGFDDFAMASPISEQQIDEMRT
jgi:hypothetical protein